MNWRAFAMCVAFLAVAGMAPIWLKSESRRAAAEAHNAAIEAMKRDAYGFLVRYAGTNPLMSIQTGPYERIELGVPEEGWVEVKLPCSGRQMEGPIEYFKFVARLRFTPERNRYRVASVGLIRTAPDGTELAPADSVRFF